MEKLKIIIIILIVFICIIVLSIFFLYPFQGKESIVDAELGNEGEVIDYENQQIQDVTDHVKYFTVANCVSRYFNQIDKENYRYYESDENGEYKLSVSQDEINQDNYDLLSKKYIEDNKITLANVGQYIDEIQGNVIFTPLSMKELLAYNMNKYIVYGFIQNSQNEFIKDVYIIVNLDVENKTFSIEPLTGEYNSIDAIQVSNENEHIVKNENNTYTDAKISYEERAKAYFNAYKRMCLSNPTIAYEYLNEEYKTARFENIDRYKQYVEKNKQELTGISINQYLVNTYEDYTEFVCKDQYENMYIFRERNINDFDCLLDTYTISTDKFKDQYSKSSNEDKVKLNTDKWVKMLNNRDYANAYNYLDETFRNNNFKNGEETFENYMRQKYPGHYKVLYGETTERNGVYAQSIILENIIQESTDQQISLDIVMKLEDDMNFVMSYTIFTK